MSKSPTIICNRCYRKIREASKKDILNYKKLKLDLSFCNRCIEACQIL